MSRLFIREIYLHKPLPQDSYLNGLPVVRHLQSQPLTLTAPVTCLVGENGTGKSTLIEAIAVAAGFNPEGGTRNFNFSTAATHAGLWEYLTLVKPRLAADGFFLRAESFYNVASYIDELDRVPAAAPPVAESYGGRSLHEQSHGESFLSLVQNRFHGDGLFILDEPEAALSPMRQMTLLYEIHALAQQGAQFIMATHSPLLTALPGAQVWELSQNGIAAVDYQNTEHFRVTKAFLNSPERMLSYLLEEKE